MFSTQRREDLMQPAWFWNAASIFAVTARWLGVGLVITATLGAIGAVVYVTDPALWHSLPTLR